MASTNSTKLELSHLKDVVSGRATAIRCKTRLQPAAGMGTKVFPPTHADGKYALEKRRIAGPAHDKTQEIDCVLLDSVQSQANRIEEALQLAIDNGLISLPLFVVDFAGQVEDIQRVTSLEAPHRAADAILRDSLIEGKPFRQSPAGLAITNSNLSNATGLFQYCPHALVLGIWDSTGPKGGMGSKFARALVSEIVGINVAVGKKTSSRIDPLQTRRGAMVVKNSDGSWSLAKDEKAKNAVSPAEINHGNIPPDISDGGVTIEYAEHTAVLSLPQLRRLRFPINGKLNTDITQQKKIDDAARTALAALALMGLTLSLERGCDLRSRCLLFPEAALQFELLDTPGNPERIALDSATAIALYAATVKEAQALGLPWETKPIKLEPSPQMIAMVKKSQALAAASQDNGD